MSAVRAAIQMRTAKFNCCASAAITPIYYISFCVLSTFVMLNLVVATLMGELERAGVESDGEAATVAVAAEDDDAKNKPSVDTNGKAGDTVTDFVAAEAEEEEESPKPAPSPVSGELSSVGSLVDDGPSGVPSRVKLEPLEKIPARPLSPSVFEPFAPETIAHDEPEEVVQEAVANSEAQ